MIARYTDHAANERTFLAWIRTGLTVAAFGLFLVKLNIAVDAAGGHTLLRRPQKTPARWSPPQPAMAGW
jgi:putative membrane protein